MSTDSMISQLIFNSTVFKSFAKFSSQLMENEAHFAAPCILVNLFHFTVLTRKSMRTAPIFIIMAAISLLDISSSLYSIHLEILEAYKTFIICYDKVIFTSMQSLEILMDGIRNVARRSSTWLTFSITLIRTLVIRNAMNPKFDILSKPKIALVLILLVPLVFTPIQYLGPYKNEYYFGNFNCTPNATRSSYTYVWYTKTEFPTPIQDRVITIHKTIEGLSARILPCVLFPVVTLFLIREIKKAEVQRQKLSSSTTNNTSKNTSNLVLAQTLTFFIAELPLGILYMLKPREYQSNLNSVTNSDYVVTKSLENFFSVLLTITTASHMVICTLMSSQYRETALRVIKCGYVSKIENPEIFVSIARKT